MPPKKAPTKPTPPPDVIDDKMERTVGPRLAWTGELQPSPGAHPIGRCFHSVSMWDGKLFVFGGWSGVAANHVKTIQSFDFASTSWNNVESTGDVHEALSQCATAQGPRGLLFIGGWTGKGRSAALTQYLFEANQWEPIVLKERSLPGLTFHSACAVQNRVFVFGGNTVEGQSNDMYMLDLSNQTVSLASALSAPTKRSSHTASLLRDELIVVIGGRGVDGAALSDVAVFDTTSSGQWSTNIKIEGSLPPRYGHSALPIGDNILVFGGVSDAGLLLNDVWMLNCEKSNVFSWSKVSIDEQSSPPDPRMGHCAVESMSSMFLVGGRAEGHSMKCDIVGLDTSSLAPLPTMNDSLPPGSEHGSPTPTSDRQ